MRHLTSRLICDCCYRMLSFDNWTAKANMRIPEPLISPGVSHFDLCPECNSEVVTFIEKLSKEKAVARK